MAHNPLCWSVSHVFSLLAWRKYIAKRKEPPVPLQSPSSEVFQLNPRNLMGSFKEQEVRSYLPIHLGPKRLWCCMDMIFGRGYLLFENVFKGKALATSIGEWRQPTICRAPHCGDFGMGKKGIEERIQEEAHFLVERIRNTHEKPFNPGKFLVHSVSNIICSIVFGDRFDYEDKKFLNLIEMLEENNKYQNRIQTQLYNFFPTIMDSLPGPHKTIIKNTENVDAFISEIVRTHQESFDPSCPRDFIDAFINKMNSHFHVGERFGETSIQFTYSLTEKIHKEIDRVVGRDRSPCMADRSQLPYTDAVVHEIQRFIDFLPLNVPHAVTKDTMLRDYFIPKDTLVFPLLSPILQDCKEFPNPEKFDPGHFLNANGTFRKSDYFMPFSTGKRICAGEGLARMEIFLFLTSILQNFTLKPVVDRKDIDTTPVMTSLANMPRLYEVSFIPR
uniref:unspecific monooxygenase n=1 Tax=Coturnix japonica TaxID=93934 RepID=A0A8C2U5L2_COTJA